MKKQLLLPFLFIALYFSACTPDDNVDMPQPEPQKPISELIEGDWDLYMQIDIDSSGNETPSTKNQTLVYSISNNSYYVIDYPYEGGAGGRYGDYTIFESDGKNYIETDEDVSGHAVFQITSITDSTMTWEMTDSLAQLSDAYQGEHFKMKFKTLQSSPRIKVLGNWNATKSTKVTYDALGNVISTEEVTPDIKLLQFTEDENVFVYWNQDNSDAAYRYVLEQGADTTSLILKSPAARYATILHATITAISDSEMIWEQEESPTVSYITEFTKVVKPTVSDNSVASKIIGEWTEQDTTNPYTYVLDGSEMQIYTNPDEVFATVKYSVIERNDKTYLSYQEAEDYRYNYEITQLSDSSMTWVPVHKLPFLPGYNENTYGSTTVLTRSK
ncbi:hypothetical protein I2I11_05835 [Pontibacter sp. 172403-2]|uniref:hypothetical protein n=1 Tax=Pontibacter rufus TaxID=2791028 RepID=UPI0018AF5D08|nr:hypothetical protein [Pontibacter sp. 172403-2]MBF9252801.1 hypothetical protein [Pontibacter sp. 172403-2]